MSMDYGRAAFLKTEDLERRVDAAFSAPKIRNAYTSVHPNFRLNSGGGFDAAACRGDGSMALIVKLDVATETRGRIEVYVDGARAGSVNVETGKSAEIIMNNVTVTDGGRLSLAAANGFDGVVESVEITLIGANAGFERTVFGWAADTHGDFSVILTNEDGRLFMRSCADGSLPVEGTEAVFVAKAVRAAATALDGVYYIVYSDASSNLWGCSAESAHTVSKKVRLGGGADSVAVAPYLDGLLIVMVINGAMKYFTTDFEFNIRSQPADVDSSVRADSVVLIKNAQNPSLVYFSGGKSYLKTLEKETASKASIAVTVEYSVIHA